MGIVEEAQAARDAGSAWRARDLLTDHVERERDPEALALLGQVLYDMGDLPRAGAIWFASGATGPEADAAVAAWREQSGDDFVVMWGSLPASVQAEPRPRRVEALRAKALAAGGHVDRPAGEVDRPGGEVGRPGGEVGRPGGEATAVSVTEDEDGDNGRDAAWLVAWILAVVFVVFAVIGFITALGWLVPG